MSAYAAINFVNSLATAAVETAPHTATHGEKAAESGASMIEPSIIFSRHWIETTFHSVGGEHFVVVIMSVIVIISLAVFLRIATTGMLTREPSPLQNLVELIYESLEGYVLNIMGPVGQNFIVLIGSLFIYIFCCNLMGIIPGLESPTSNLNTTIAIALVTFLSIHYYGLKTQGLKYFKHFAGDIWWLAPLMIPIHIIGELARPLSLSIRLFGNIRGEDIAICILFFLGAKSFFPFFHTPMLFLACFTSLIQALVFTMLSMAYISGALPHEEHGHGDHDETGHNAPEHSHDSDAHIH